MDDDLIIKVINDESVLHYLHVMEQLIIKSIQEDVNLIANVLILKQVYNNVYMSSRKNKNK